MKGGIVTCIALSKLAQKCNLSKCILHNLDLNSFPYVSLKSWGLQGDCLKGPVVISLKGDRLFSDRPILKSVRNWIR